MPATNLDWKRDIVRVLENNLKDAIVLKDKYIKLVDAFDDPGDFQSAIPNIKGKTDLGIAFTEILKEFVDRNIEEAAAEAEEEEEKGEEEEEKPKKKRAVDEDDDEEGEEEL